MRRRVSIVLHAGLLLAGLVSSGAAQSTEQTRAALRVRGSADCLEQTAVESQVRDRSKRIAFVAATAEVPLLVVDARRKAGGSLAVELRVSWPDKRRSRRELAADGCEDATSAVAFLIALTLDPQAASQSPGGVASSAAESTPAVPTAGSNSAAGTPAAEAPPQDGPSAASPSATVAARTSNSPQNPSEVDAEDAGPTFFAFDHVAFGAGAVLVGAVAPNLMPGLAVHALVAFGGSGVLAPALQLTAAHAWVNGLSQSGGVADFQRTTLRLDLCPIALKAAVLTARACVSSAAGSLNAQGSSTYVPRSSSRGWLDVGASLRATAELGPVFQVVAGTTLAVPLRRDSFEFRPDVFHRVSAVSWEGQLGLGLRFP